MWKLLSVLLVLAAADAEAKSLKFGTMIDNYGTNAQNDRRIRPQGFRQPAEKSCLTNDDCSFDRECVALRCLHVCTKDTCVSGKYCIAHKNKPHVYQCVDCVISSHCPKGMECSPKTLTCVEKDVCRDAVCSPAAPYCIKVPYKTLPYTCVQCLTDEHCPPVAGLTRSCVDNYCLFNVENNIPRQTGAPDSLPQTEEDFPYEEDDGEYDSDGTEYAD
ncbi:MAG TPA: hypothetical protein DD624_00260 [Alphaproteobacteria bacterium]|nr:hypothetical protein [Alphaproteobacteria bacterium]